MTKQKYSNYIDHSPRIFWPCVTCGHGYFINTEPYVWLVHWLFAQSVYPFQCEILDYCDYSVDIYCYGMATTHKKKTLVSISLNAKWLSAPAISAITNLFNRLKWSVFLYWGQSTYFDVLDNEDQTWFLDCITVWWVHLPYPEVKGYNRHLINSI